jgi:ABC-2 type transport system permease protein
MNKPILSMIKKEFIEIKRSKLIALLIIAPIIQVIIFGYVATTDIKNVKTVICDRDNSSLSRKLSEKFLNSEYFKVVDYVQDEKKIDELISKNKAVIGINIPERFSENIKKGKKTSVQLIIDGTDSNMSTISLSRAIMIINAFSEDCFKEKIEIMKKIIGGIPSLVMEERVWYNPELKSANTMVPGVAGLILTIVTLAITAVAIVREKETGNIEQIIVTPIKPAEIIAGKVIPYIIIALLDVILNTLASILVFRINFEGSFTLLIALSLFMIFANLGIGIYVSTISSTQQQALLSSIFFAVPSILLSGFLFPIKNMPEILQLLTYLIPMRYYMVILRGIFLKGLTFFELLPQTLALLIFGIIIFTLAIKQFRKTIG